MNLVLVESPAKAKTIEKYLGKEFKVKATLGHVIDLPKSSLAVDVDKNYEPQFTVIKGKGELIKKLKKEIPEKGQVYLAMDPDREGEAIAYHVASALKLKKPQRISFHEITKTAVTEALEHPRDLDQNLVDAQFARRILDRLVGYKLSELLWKKMWYGLSAGRVQSVALRLIVEREEEIEAFVPVNFWEITANLTKDKQDPFEAKLVKINGKKETILEEEKANDIYKDIDKKDFKVVGVHQKEVSKHAFPPYTTSTLQQSANRILGLSSKRTMALAQGLYQAGHITYMRTDSTNMSAQAIDEIRKYIEGTFGKEYVPAKPNFYKTKVKNAQEAHEAIRPTSVSLSPKEMEGKVDGASLKLYSLIWKRALSSQMENKKALQMSVEIEPVGTKEKYTFILSGEKIVFDGFRKVLPVASDEEKLQVISDLRKDDILRLVELLLLKKATQPKPRFTEASLVKMLESLGIGRPSTYATIISTVIDRGYVGKLEKQLAPTDVGRVVSNFLEKNFLRLVDYKYTANVEQELDDIAEGNMKYVPFIDSQYKPLISEIEQVGKDVTKESVVILGDSEEKCDKCGAKMIVRLGKNGKFLSCSKFPECKGIKSLDGEFELDEAKYVKEGKCEKCGNDLVIKTGKYGKFWACSNYPDCKTTKPLLLQEKCPECGKSLVEKMGKWGRGFTGCSGYPDCKYIKKAKKKESE